MSERGQAEERYAARSRVSLLVAVGLFPSLAVATKLANGILLGLGVLVVLAVVSLVASLLRTVVEEQGQSYVQIVTAALAATGVAFALQAIAPAASRSLGLYVSLIAVNALVLDRAATYARANTPGRALLDALYYGIGFLACLAVVALLREALGAGTVTFFPVGGWKGVIVLPWLSKNPIRVAALPAGAFLAAGYLLALYRRAAVTKGGDPE